jgi:hypothetical protein
MRYLLTLLFAGMLWLSVPGESQAWGRYPYGYGVYNSGYYNSGYYNPGFYMPPVYGSAAYVGPYGYRSFYNFNSYPTYYGGYNTVYSAGAWQQPYVAAPFHSVYFNPYANTYQYGTGLLNTPVYSYFYGY